MKNYLISIALIAVYTTAHPQSSNVTLDSKWLHDYSDFETIFVAGNYAYCSIDSIMYILDISNPSVNPSSVKGLSQVIVADHINWIYVINSKAYIAQDDSGMCIVDVSNPYIPVKMGSCATPDRALSLKVSGNYAYVAADTAGIRIIDVSNPNAPSEVSFFDLGINRVWEIDISGNYAYIAYGADGFRILDISNPLNPVASGFLPTLNCVNVFVQGNYAYVMTTALNIVNISNPASPVIVGSPFGLSSYSLFVSGSYAYIHDTNADAYDIWDVSNPSSPALAGQYPTFSNFPYFQSIFVSGSTAYFTRNTMLATDFGTMDIVNVSNPSLPELSGSYSVPQISTGLCSKGHYLYSGGWTPPGAEMISVFDIIDPAHPTQVGMFIDTLSFGFGDAYTMVISGNYLYLSGTETAAGNIFGFKIIDISNPLNPVRAGMFSISNSSLAEIAVKGNYAYAGGNTSGLVVVDVSNPALPVQVSSLILSGGFPPGYISISGNYAYITDNAMKMHIVDITNPLLPSEAGIFQLSASGTDIYAEGNFAYVANGGGFQIIDATIPASPVLIGSYNAGGVEISKQGNFVYLSDFNNGMQVVDVSNPANPVQAGYYYDIADYGRNIHADSLHSYLATDEGIYIFDLASVTSSGVVLEPKNQFSVYPNPAKDFLQIRNHSFQNNETLSIYNSLGEQVKSFTASKTFFIGDLPKGLYLVQLKNEKGIVGSEKIVVE